MSFFKTILGSAGALAFALAATSVQAASWRINGGAPPGGFHTFAAHGFGNFQPGFNHFHPGFVGGFGHFPGGFNHGFGGQPFASGLVGLGGWGWWAPYGFGALNAPYASAAVVGPNGNEYGGYSGGGGACVLYQVVYDKQGRVTGQRPVASC